MGQKMDIQEKKVITPKFRVSFPNVFKAKSFKDQEAKYSTVMLFSKKTDLSAMKKAAENAAIEKWGPKDQWPKKKVIKKDKSVKYVSLIKMPFRDGDIERADKEGYEGHIFVNASSKKQPGLVDEDRQAIINEEDFYAGCYARAELIAFAYDNSGNMGVSFSLQNIQKMGDGEAFSGRRNAEDVFDTVEKESDDASNYEDGESEDDEDAGNEY